MINNLKKLTQKTLDNLYIYNNKLTKIILKTEKEYYYITLKRHKNNIYGNPLYKITIYKSGFVNEIKLLKGIIYKCYVKKGYGLIESYSIQDDLRYIFNKIFKNWEIEEIY